MGHPPSLGPPNSRRYSCQQTMDHSTLRTHKQEKTTPRQRSHRINHLPTLQKRSRRRRPCTQYMHHAAVSQKIKLRHDGAVQMLLDAIQIFSKSMQFRHYDTPNIKTPAGIPRRPPAKAKTRKLPEGILPKCDQTSLPDITLINIPREDMTRYIHNGGTVPREVRQRHTVDIIEVKYTYDLLVHVRAKDAIAQHTQLQVNLLAAGWGTVTIHPFIIGSAGTIRQACHKVLSACGITERHAQDVLLRKLAIFSARRTTNIVKTRLSHKEAPATPNATDILSPPDTDDTPPPSPSDPPPDTPDDPRNSPPPHNGNRNTTDSPTAKAGPFNQPPPITLLHVGAPRRGQRTRTPSQRRQEMTPDTRRRLYGPDASDEDRHTFTQSNTPAQIWAPEMTYEPVAESNSTPRLLPDDPADTPAVPPSSRPADDLELLPTDNTAQTDTSQPSDDCQSPTIAAEPDGHHTKRKWAPTAHQTESHHAPSTRRRVTPPTLSHCDPRVSDRIRKRRAPNTSPSPCPPQRWLRGRVTPPLSPATDHTVSSTLPTLASTGVPDAPRKREASLLNLPPSQSPPKRQRGRPTGPNLVAGTPFDRGP